MRLAILAVLMSAVSLYYYIRFIKAMYIDGETEPEPITVGASLQVALAIAAALVVYIGVFPQRLISLTQKAATTSGLRVYTYGQKPDDSSATGGSTGKVGPARPAACPASSVMHVFG